MAKHKKRKPAKNSNYQTSARRDTGLSADSRLKDRQEKKRTGKVSSLFFIVCVIFLIYFVINVVNASGPIQETLVNYLLPAAVTGAVGLVLYRKDL